MWPWFMRPADGPPPDAEGRFNFWCADCEVGWLGNDPECWDCGQRCAVAKGNERFAVVAGSQTPELERTRLEQEVLAAMRRGEWP